MAFSLEMYFTYTITYLLPLLVAWPVGLGVLGIVGMCGVFFWAITTAISWASITRWNRSATSST